MPPASTASSSKRPKSVALLPQDRTKDDSQRRRTVSFAPEELDVEVRDQRGWPFAVSSDMEGLGIRSGMRREEDHGRTTILKSGDSNAHVGEQYEHAFDEHDVSDIEEEDDDDEQSGQADAEKLHTPSPLSQSHSHSPSQQPRRQDSPFHQSSSPAESHKEALQALESPPHPSSQPDVSPVREGNARQHDVHSNDAVPSTEHTVDLQERQHQQEQEQEQHERSQRQSSSRIDLNGNSTRNSDDDASERRDTLTVPITPNTPRNSSNSPILQQGSRLSFHALPSSVNNSRNSLAKAPMHSPPNRRTSTRSSHNPYNTTQIPYNKERLRYSWQSLQDDEPNRPRIHIIKLVSNTATASAGFPTGEAFGFSISPGGRRIAAYNSARLYVLQTAALPVGISQEYALKRRPLAVELTDDGNTLAILSDDHTVNVYDVKHQVKRSRTIKLDFPSNCIALAPTGGLLAAAYEGGIEIFSLDPSALPSDRRAVRSIKMDRMTFSEDGSTLLGTTTRIHVSSTVVVSVPVFPSAATGVPTHAELKESWCSELLHPENIRNSSHAVFMRESRKNCNDRLFAWNGLEDTFGLLHVADMHYGNVEFPVVISPPLSTCGGLGAAIHSCPAIDEHGDTVAMVVNDRTIRLYIVPRKQADDRVPMEAHSIDHELDEGYGCPFSEVRWVHSSASLPSPEDESSSVKGRLIVTSPGGVSEFGISNESVEDVEGGRIILFDFDPQFAGQPGQTFSLILGKSPPQILEEEEVDVAEEVALVRRRTVNQRQRGGLSQRPTILGRAATAYGGHLRRGPSAAGRSNRTSMLSIGTLQSEGARSLPDLLETGEQAEIYEEPYVQGAPRSHASLRRAASNAQRHRYQTLEERNRERISVDSNGNFLSLPEYTEEPNAPLPQRFRALAGLETSTPFRDPSKADSALTLASSDVLPLTAPADVGENFNSDQAFRSANAMREDRTMSPSAASMRPETDNEFRDRSASPQITTAASIRSVSTTNNNFYPTLRGGEPHRPSSPATSTRTMDSVQQLRNGPSIHPAFLPRSLQRAYSNAVSPLPASDSRSASRAGNTSALGTYYAGSVQEEDEPWDMISPVAPSGTMSPFEQRLNANRFSQQQRLESRNGSVVSSSTNGFGPSTQQRMLASESRRLPPHILAFRQAAAANAANAIPPAMQAPPNVNRNGQTSASLFPASVPRDQIPLRQPSVRAGGQAHPVTAWHPPAPAVNANAMPGSSHSGRQSTLGTKARKKKGLFSRREKVDGAGVGKENGRPETPVWMPEKGQKEKGCVVM